MDHAAPSMLDRHRPAILGFAGLFTLGSIFFVWYSLGSLPPGPQPLESSKLQRRRAIRRRQRRDAAQRGDDAASAWSLHAERSQVGVEMPSSADSDFRVTPRTSDETIGHPRQANAMVMQEAPLTTGGRTGDNDTERETSPDDTAPTPEAQRLMELAYAIAKSAHDREGIVHHGVTCDRCNAVPIVGVRYHCANCPDFDLCEDCESTNCHLKTHVFYKMRIPAPWGGKEPVPVWYPGLPSELPPSLDAFPQLRKQLSDASNFTMGKIEGLYQQFACMANCKLPESRDHAFPLGIDRAAFNHCFTQQIMTKRPTVPSLIHDRLFRMFDRDGDGIINLEEFIMGTALVHKKLPRARRPRIFDSLDLDEDGFLSREDCLKVLRSFHDLNREVLLGYLRVDRTAENALLVERRDDARTHIQGGRSLASYFAGFSDSEVQYEFWNLGDAVIGKHMDETGNVVADLDTDTIRNDADDTEYITPADIASGAFRDYRAIYREELLRGLTGRRMQYMSGHIWIVDDTRTEKDTHLARRDDGTWWVSTVSAASKTAYIEAPEESLRALHPHFEKSKDDQRFTNIVRTRAESELLTHTLPSLFVHHDVEKHRQHAMYAKFRDAHPDDEEVVPSDAADFIGGSAAAHTICNVVAASLNQLLDPIFHYPETMALEVANTAVARETRAPEIEKFLESLFDQVWGTHGEDNVTLVEETRRQPDRLDDSPDDACVNSDEVKVRLAQGRPLFGPLSIERTRQDLVCWTRAWSHEQARINPNFQVGLDQLSEVDKREFIHWRLRIAARIDAEAHRKHIQQTHWRAFHDVDGTAEAETAPSGSDAASSDATMPQNRPDAALQAKPMPEHDLELFHLACMAAVDMEAERRGGPGRIDYDEFDRAATGWGNHEPLLAWIEAWLDLVVF